MWMRPYLAKRRRLLQFWVLLLSIFIGGSTCDESEDDGQSPSDVRDGGRDVLDVEGLDVGQTDTSSMDNFDSLDSPSAFGACGPAGSNTPIVNVVPSYGMCLRWNGRFEQISARILDDEACRVLPINPSVIELRSNVPEQGGSDEPILTLQLFNDSEQSVVEGRYVPGPWYEAWRYRVPPRNRLDHDTDWQAEYANQSEYQNGLRHWAALYLNLPDDVFPQMPEDPSGRRSLELASEPPLATVPRRCEVDVVELSRTPGVFVRFRCNTLRTPAVASDPDIRFAEVVKGYIACPLAIDTERIPRFETEEGRWGNR